MGTTFLPLSVSALPTSLNEDTAALAQSITQLNSISPLTANEKWDAICAVLAKPSLSIVNAKNSPFLKSYLNKIEDTATGDGMAVLDSTELAITLSGS